MAWIGGARRQVSLLLDHGHPDAWSYPVGFLFEEAAVVRERLDGLLATQAGLMQMALCSVPNMSVKPTATKKAVARFNDLLKRLQGST